MANVTSQLIVRLIDGVSAPAKAAAGALQGIGRAAANISGRLNGPVLSGLNNAIKQNERTIERLRGKMIDAMAAGYALKSSIGSVVKASADFETIMLDIGMKADLGDEKIKALGKQIRQLSREINQTSHDTAKGVDFLAGMGLTPDKAMTLMSPIGRAATAYRAQIDDLAKAGFAALDNLKVKPEEFARALDIMAQSGKEGAFELRDMAQYFPQLTAAAEALKMTGTTGVGRLAAALQIARKGAGDASSAATNTANLMQKIVSPETTRKFQKLGIDIRKELELTQKTGGDVFEMIARLTDKALKGNLSNMGDLFEDAQVQQFLRPLIQKIDEYKKIRDTALKANGVVDADFERRLKTMEAGFNRISAAAKELAITIGNILAPAIAPIMDVLLSMAKAAESFADTYPEFTRGVIVATAGLVGIRIAAIGAGWAIAFMKGPTLVASALLVRFAALLSGGIAAGFALALVKMRSFMVGLLALNMMGPAAALGTLGGAIARLGLAVLMFPVTALRAVGAAMWTLVANPVGAVIAAIVVALVALGIWVANNWEGIKVFFSAFGDGFTKALGPEVGEVVEKISSALGGVVSWLKQLFGPLDETGTKWRSWGEAVGGVAASGVNMIAAAIGKVIGLLGAAIDKMVAFGRATKNAFTGGDFVPMSGGVDVSKIPARAKGGPLQSGQPTLVGERGPEIITSSRNGYVHPNHALGGFAPTINVGGIHVTGGDPKETADRVYDVLESRIRSAFRGIQADAGMKFA